MSQSDSLFGNIGIPKSFTYRDLRINLISLNEPMAETIIFMASPLDGVDLSSDDILQYADSIPRDALFAILVCLIYHLTLQKVDVRMELDELEQEASFYIVCKAISSSVVYSTYQQTVPLFARTLGRMDNVIYDVAQPFTMRNLTDNLDELSEEQDDDPTNTIRGIMRAEVCFPTNRMSMTRYIQPYGATISVNLTNYPKLKKSHPFYAMIRHDSMIFEHVFPALKQVEDSIRNYLDPMHLMNIMYRHMFVDMNRSIPVDKLILKDVIEVASVNGVEIYDANPSWITIRPPQCDDLIRASSLIDWGRCNPVLAQIATAILSDNGTLFIPEIASLDTTYHSGKWWLRLYLRPHFAYFTKDRAFYGDREALNTYANEFFWLQSNITDQIQFIFPTLYPMHDPTVLCYGRVMRHFLQGITFEAFAEILTCKEIKVRVCAQIDNWVYFAVVDDTLVQDAAGSVFFDGKFIADISSEKDTKIENVFDTLIGAFASANPRQILQQIDPEVLEDVKRQYNGDEDRIIFDAWESSVNMQSRSFAKKYYEVRHRIFRQAAAANGTLDPAKAAEESFRLRLKFNAVKFTDIAAAQNQESTATVANPEASSISSLIGRIFGHGKS